MENQPIPDDQATVLPLDEETSPDSRVSLHAVLVRGEDAFFDDDALHGRSTVESRVEWATTPDEVPGGDRWNVVWVAVDHEPGGARAYRGLAAAEMWVSPAEQRGFKDADAHSRSLDAALRGDVALDTLEARERAALREALVMQDADAFDRARPEVHRTLRGTTAVQDAE